MPKIFENFYTNNPVSPGQHAAKLPVLLSIFRYQTDPTLAKITTELIAAHGAYFTEHYRPKYHANDLHGVLPVRALDCRSYCYGPNWREKIHEIAAWINSRWQYDPKRPHMKCALVHSNRATIGIHMHLQTHPRTIRRKEQSYE